VTSKGKESFQFKLVATYKASAIMNIEMELLDVVVASAVLTVVVVALLNFLIWHCVLSLVRESTHPQAGTHTVNCMRD